MKISIGLVCHESNRISDSGGTSTDVSLFTIRSSFLLWHRKTQPGLASGLRLDKLASQRMKRVLEDSSSTQARFASRCSDLIDRGLLLKSVLARDVRNRSKWRPFSIKIHLALKMGASSRGKPTILCFCALPAKPVRSSRTEMVRYFFFDSLSSLTSVAASEHGLVEFKWRRLYRGRVIQSRVSDRTKKVAVKFIFDDEEVSNIDFTKEFISIPKSERIAKMIR